MPNAIQSPASKPSDHARSEPEARSLIARLRKAFSITDAQAQTLAQIKFPCC